MSNPLSHHFPSPPYTSACAPLCAGGPLCPLTFPPDPLTTKAYRNNEFLNSGHARHIRILCEYEESLQRMRAAGIRATIMFFGSARSKDKEQYADAFAKANAAIAKTRPGSDDRELAEAALDRLKKGEWMCEYMEKIRELAKRLTSWSIDTKYRLKNQVCPPGRDCEFLLLRCGAGPRPLPNRPAGYRRSRVCLETQQRASSTRRRPLPARRSCTTCLTPRKTTLPQRCTVASPRPPPFPPPSPAAL